MDKPISYGINKIKVGYIFIFLNINFSFSANSTIDLLPDFIGYYILLYGISSLVIHRKSMATLEGPAIFMVVLTFVNAFTDLFLKGIWDYFYLYIWDVFRTCVFVYLHFAVITEVYYLCKDHGVNSRGIETGRNFLLAFHTAIVIISRFLPLETVPDFLLSFLVIFTFVLSLTVLFFYITMINSLSKIEKDFKEKEKKPIPPL